MSRQSLDEASRDKGQRSLLVDIVSPRPHSQENEKGIACERVEQGSEKAPHRKQHVYEPTCYGHCAPQVPRVAPAILVAVQFPAAELLIQPPAIRTVAHLDVREPLRDNRDDRGIHSDASTCA